MGGTKEFIVFVDYSEANRGKVAPKRFDVTSSSTRSAAGEALDLMGFEGESRGLQYVGTGRDLKDLPGQYFYADGLGMVRVLEIF